MLTHPAERRLTFPLGELEASGQLFIPVGRDSIGAVVILEGLRTAAPRDEALGQQLGPHLAERGLALLVLGDARAERVLTPQGLAVDRALLDTGIALLEEHTGLAASLLGIGLNSVHVIEAAAEGLAHAAAVWDMDLEDFRTLETAWQEPEECYRLANASAATPSEAFVEMPGDRAYVRALAQRMDAVRSRQIPVPLLAVVDQRFRSGVDRVWFGVDTLQHRLLVVSAGGNIARPPGAGGWAVPELLSTTVEWLASQRRRVLADEPRIAGRLTTPAVPVPESRGRVFISYKHGDESRPRAESAKSFLQAAGFRVFLDRDSLETGDLRRIIERAINEDCSAGLLIVTQELAHSSFIPRVELPALLANALRQGVALSVDNAINDPNDPERLDAAQPERILQLGAGILDGCTQYNLLAPTTKHRDGMDVFVQRILTTRLRPLRGRPVYLDIQTYDTLHVDATENRTADLRIRGALRLHPTDARPRLDVLHRFQLTLSLISAELHAIQPDRVVVTGGAHPSIALALGGALVSTRLQRPVIIEDRHGAWGVEEPDASDPHLHDLSVEDVPLPNADQSARRVAVLVGGSQTIPSLFTSFVENLAAPIRAAAYLRVTGEGWIQSSEGSRLARRLAEEIEKLARSDDGPCEILLCYALGFPLGVMIGRQLNKYSVVAYDLVNQGSEKWYRRILRLDPSDSHIAEVFDDPVEASRPGRFA